MDVHINPICNLFIRNHFFIKKVKKWVDKIIKINKIAPTQCGNSSVGRAQPCQGWGREFESRFPLQCSYLTLVSRKLLLVIML